MHKEEKQCVASMLFPNYFNVEDQKSTVSDVMNEARDEKERKKIASQNFWSIIATLSDGVYFPNGHINKIMVAFSNYVEKGKIKIVGDQSEGGMIKHILEEQNDSTLCIPREFGFGQFALNSMHLSQITYAVIELVIFEKNKENSKNIPYFQIRDYAIAHEAELLLTLRVLSRINKWPLVLTQSQEQVLKWYPQGLRSFNKSLD